MFYSPLLTLALFIHCSRTSLICSSVRKPSLKNYIFQITAMQLANMTNIKRLLTIEHAHFVKYLNNKKISLKFSVLENFRIQYSECAPLMRKQQILFSFFGGCLDFQVSKKRISEVLLHNILCKLRTQTRNLQHADSPVCLLIINCRSEPKCRGKRRKGNGVGVGVWVQRVRVGRKQRRRGRKKERVLT